MFDTSYFVLLFVILELVMFGGLFFFNKNSTPLRKAWNVYTAMSISHALLFLGMMSMLPVTLKSSPSKPETYKIETIVEVKEILKEQREDIEQLRNQVDQTAQTILTSALILLFFAPILYYNLFKYNLEIEKLSGKRMGSFD